MQSPLQRTKNWDLNTLFIIAVACWTLVLGFMLFKMIERDVDFEKEIALAKARTLFQKSRILQFCVPPNAAGGGKSGLKSMDSNPMAMRLGLSPEEAPQSPHVFNPSSGKESESAGLTSRFTSQRLSTQNFTPDRWEEKAIQRLRAGESDFSEVVAEANGDVLRFAGPVKATAECSSCHALNMGKTGEMAGAISIRVPLPSSFGGIIPGSHSLAAFAFYAVLWGVGLLGLYMGKVQVQMRYGDQGRFFKRLAENEEKFRLLFEHAPIASMTIDAGGKVLAINEEFTAFLGYSLAEIENRPLSELIAAAGWDKWEEFKIRHHKGLPVDNIEIPMLHRDGHIMEISLHGRIERLPDSEHPRLQCVLLDYSGHRKILRALKESEDRYQLIAENMGDVLFLYDNALGRLEYVSPSVNRVLHTREDQIIGKPITDFFLTGSVERMQAEHEERLESFEAGNTARATEIKEVVLKTPDGQLIPTEIVTTLLPDHEGRPTRMLGVIREISKRKQYESALATLLRGTSSSTGDDYGKTLVCELAHTLKTRYVFLGLLSKEQPSRIRTLVFWVNGRLVDNIEYDPIGMPCELVIRDKARKFFPRDLHVLFPKNDLADQIKLESYIGAPLLGRDGRCIGIMSAMDLKPMEDNPTMEALFSIFAARAGAEIERSEALDALSENANRFKQIIENSRAGYFRLGLDGRYEDINQAWLELHGYTSKDEVIGKHFSLTQVENKLAEMSGLFEQVLSGRKLPPGEATRRRKDGATGYHTYSARAVIEAGRTVGFECFIIDTTALRRIEADYAMLFNEMIDGFAIGEIVCDEIGVPSDFKFLSVNPAFERLTGHAATEVIGQAASRILPETSRFLTGEFGPVALNGTSLSFEYEDPSVGKVFLVTAFQSAERRFAYTFTDITKRKHAEANLAKDEAELAAIHEHVPMMLLLLDANGRVRRCNRMAAEYSGIDAENIQEHTPGSFLHCCHAFDKPGDCCGNGGVCSCGLKEALIDSIRTGESHHRQECTLKLAKGDEISEVTLLYSTARVKIGSESLGLLCIEDITPQKQAEARIRQQAALLDITRDAICVLSSDYTIEYWNRGAESMFGWTAGEATGCDWETLIFKEESEEFRSAWNTILEKGEWMGQFLALNKDGVTRTLQCRGTRVESSKEQPASVLLVCTDITEAKQLETQLLHMQRIESLGSIASGIAHDLNNILSPMMMSVDLLPSRLTNPDDAALIEMLRTSAHRGSEIVQQLLLFSRGSNTPRQPVSPSKIILEMASIARQTFPRNITLLTEVPDGIWEILGDSTQLHQVVLNLCVNARDAMIGGGTLTMQAENCVIESDRGEISAGDYVMLHIVDTGCGIATEHLDLIFDPFFTTKPVGKGTGLGLSTALGIIKGHGGHISVKSSPGSGTEFSILLPALTGISRTDVEAPIENEFNGRGELILIVDDEQSVQQLLELSLQKHNYRVMVASDGANALDLFAQNVSEIKAVITDLMMPNMDGILTVQCLRQIKPQIPIIAMSGMHEQMLALEKSGEQGVPFVLKPFTIRKILTQLRELLGDRQPS